MSAKRKAAFKLAMPVAKQNPKRPTKFSIDETRATVATGNGTTNATSEKATVPETIEISSSSSSQYDDSEEEKDETWEEQQDAPEQQTIQDDDEEMVDAGAASPKPAAQAEDDNSDSGPTFNELVLHLMRENDDIDVPPTPTGQHSTAVTVGRSLPTPIPSSLGTVLTQALRTDDNDLLESCLRVSENNTVRSTIQRLDSSLVGTLLTKLATRLHRRPGRAGTLMGWVQWALVCHGGALAKDPDVRDRLTTLQLVLKERSQGLSSLLMLKGKLDMLEGQVTNRRAVLRQVKLLNEQDAADEEAVIYVEGGDQDSDDEQMADAEDHMPLVNGIGSDDSEEEEDEDDDDDEEESNGEEMHDEDEVNQEDQDTEEEDDSDFAEAAAPPTKIQKTAAVFSKRR